jgi:2'-5' RNA ligase
MRLFVGIELGNRLADSVQAEVSNLRPLLRQASPDLHVRWVSRANLHLTLVFLGELPDADAAAVTAALDPPLDGSAFDLRIAGFGTFPPFGALRVIWMGVAEGERELVRLQCEVAGRVSRFVGRRESRPYSPHLTVARVNGIRGPVARAAREVLGAAAGDAGTTQVSSVTLFRSRTSPDGSVYEVLARAPLSR